MTHHALKIDTAVDSAKGDPARLAEIAAAVRAEAPPNVDVQGAGPPIRVRSCWGCRCLRGTPLYYMIYQAVVLNVLLVVSVLMHNAAARRIAAKIGA